MGEWGEAQERESTQMELEKLQKCKQEEEKRRMIQFDNCLFSFYRGETSMCTTCPLVFNSELSYRAHTCRNPPAKPLFFKKNTFVVCFQCEDIVLAAKGECTNESHALIPKVL